MVNPQYAREQLQKHFEELTPETFVENARKYSPELLEAPLSLNENAEKTERGQLILFQPHPAPLPLNAYLASALSGLSAEQRQYVFTLSDIVATVCAEQNINLYEPRKKTDPVHHAEVADNHVFKIDRDRVLASDLLIHLCHYPSTGAGEELDFAYNALVPIILVSHSETRVSRMITGIPAMKVHIEYTEPEELRYGLSDALLKLRPILEQRKLAFSKYDVNIVGEKVRTLREEAGLTREEVAHHAPHLTMETLKDLEESTDRCANPSLIQLRELAAILKTTVADLVEPDLNERLRSTLE